MRLNPNSAHYCQNKQCLYNSVTQRLPYYYRCWLIAIALQRHLVMGGKHDNIACVYIVVQFRSSICRLCYATDYSTAWSRYS